MNKVGEGESLKGFSTNLSGLWFRLLEWHKSHMSCRIYELQLDRLRLATGISPSPDNRMKPLRKCSSLRDLIVQLRRHLYD